MLQNYYTTTTNDQTHKYVRLDNRMREGSHQLTSWFSRQAVKDG